MRSWSLRVLGRESFTMRFPCASIRPTWTSRDTEYASGSGCWTKHRCMYSMREHSTRMYDMIRERNISLHNFGLAIVGY